MLPTFHTLVDVLRFRAIETPGIAAFHFGGKAWTYAWLWQQSLGVTARLESLGVHPGDRVVIAIPNGPFFLSAFFGCLLGGVTAVPIFPGSSPQRCKQYLALCDARVLILSDDLPASIIRSYEELFPEGTVLTIGEEMPAAVWEAPTITFGTVAFIQYTSGSTHDPKGVQLTHQHLLTNIKQMITGMQITKDDVFVSWLPVYHDMGLILMVLVPFFLGLKLVLLPSSLQQVHAWLGAIEWHRGSFTAAPDFAYRLAIRWMQAGHHYELSSLRVALNAAEPVRQSTVLEFGRTLGRDKVMAAGYGLAESTVGVSMTAPGTLPEVDGEGHVSVGQPFPGIRIAILKEGALVGPGEIGEILVDSPANTSGYFRNPAANKKLFWKDNYLRTGDVGYLNEHGQLFVLGRKKNVITIAGRSFYAADIEESIESLPFLRHAAAIGQEGNLEGERLLVFAEVRGIHSRGDDRLRERAIDIVQRLYDRFGVRPARVFLLRSKTIPFTFNGKKKHQQLKKWFFEGKLQENGSILFPDL